MWANLKTPTEPTSFIIKMEICPICELPINECPMHTGEMSMAGAPKFVKGYPNRILEKPGV